jgi:hypothetical protein
VLEIIILSWYFAMNEDKLAPNVIHISKKEFLIYLEAENINNAKREKTNAPFPLFNVRV